MDYEVRIGGLMRCCLQTLDDDSATRRVPPVEGERLACRWCDGKIVFSRGKWEWEKVDLPEFTKGAE